MNSAARFFDALSNTAQSIGAFGGKMYAYDAERKFYDYQNNTADRVNKLMLSFETDPDFGEIMVDDFETFARPIFEQNSYHYDYVMGELGGEANPNSELGRFLQQVKDEYNEKVNNMEPTGYMKKWNALMDDMERNIDRIGNPRAQEEARRYLDGVRRNGAASVYEKQVSNWKKATTAKEIADIDKYAKSGDTPENIMEYANQRLNRLRSVNAITEAQRGEVLDTVANVALGTSLSIRAEEILAQSNIHEARKFLNTTQDSFMYGGREYRVTDQAKDIARKKVEGVWNTAQEAEHERLQGLFQRQVDGEGRNYVTMQQIFAAKLDFDEKRRWYTMAEITTQEKAPDGEFDYETAIQHWAVLIEKGDATVNDGLTFLRSAYLDGKLSPQDELKFTRGLLNATKERFGFGSELDTLLGSIEKELKDNKAYKDYDYQLSDALGSLSLALTDTLKRSTRKDMDSPEMKARFQVLKDQFVGLMVQAAQNKLTIGGLEVPGIMQQPYDRARQLLAQFSSMPDLVYAEERSGMIRWVSPDVKNAHDKLTLFIKDRVLAEQYGLTGDLAADLRQERNGDVAAMPIFTDRAKGVSYIVDLNDTGRDFIVTMIDHNTKKETVLSKLPVIPQTVPVVPAVRATPGATTPTQTRGPANRTGTPAAPAKQEPEPYRSTTVFPYLNPRPLEDDEIAPTGAR